MESELGHARLLVNSSPIGVEQGASPIPAELLPDGEVPGGGQAVHPCADDDVPDGGSQRAHPAPPPATILP